MADELKALSHESRVLRQKAIAEHLGLPIEDVPFAVVPMVEFINSLSEGTRFRLHRAGLWTDPVFHRTCDCPACPPGGVR
jgi:hypothetical protein